MKKILIAAVAASVLLLAFAVSAAFADYGPHGGYSDTTNKCAYCHRAHTAQGEDLLNEPSEKWDRSGFCFACHGNAGAGSDVNAEGGVFIAGRGGDDATGVDGRGLRGGGFGSALMDHSWSGSSPGAPEAVTSSHPITGTAAVLWGYGDISASPNPGEANFNLTCTNCHNPHGKAAKDDA